MRGCGGGTVHEVAVMRGLQRREVLGRRVVGSQGCGGSLMSLPGRCVRIGWIVCLFL